LIFKPLFVFFFSGFSFVACILKIDKGRIFFSFFGNSKIDAFSNLLNIVVDFSLIIKLQQGSIFDLKMRHKFLLHFFFSPILFFLSSGLYDFFLLSFSSWDGFFANFFSELK